MIDPNLRVVTSTPLQELWNHNGPLIATKLRDLRKQDIVLLLQKGPLDFVEAEVGLPLRWIPRSNCFQFWKATVSNNIAESQKPFLEGYPGQFCYEASEWLHSDESVIILLFKRH